MSPIVTVLLVVLLVIVGALIIAAIWGVGIYNGLVALRNACKNAFGFQAGEFFKIEDPAEKAAPKVSF